MRTREEIAKFLAEKFKRESARLNSWGTKTDDKAALSFAMSVAEFVRSMMAESRYRELRRIQKVLDKQPSQGDTNKIWKHVEERTRATKAMAKAIENMAKDQESKKAWKPKKHKHKHHHRRHHE